MGNEKWPRKITVGNVTVKVYRVKHDTAKLGVAYVVAHSDGGGRKLSKFADQAEALQEGRLKAEQLNAGYVEGAAMTASDRSELQHAREIAGAVPLISALEEWKSAREICQGSLLQACQLWAQTHRSKIEDVTVEEACKRFLAAKKKAGVDISAGLSRTLPKFVEKFGTQSIGSVSVKAIQSWLDEKDDPSTRNTCRKRIITFFRWARKVDLLPSVAQTEAEKTDQAKEGEMKKGTISTEQYSQILHLIWKTQPELLATTVLAGFCGLRRKELHGQKWSDISLEEKHLRVTDVKNGTPAERIVTLCPAAVEWLQLCDRTGEFVAPSVGIDRVRELARKANPPIFCPKNAFRHSYISHRCAATSKVEETSMEAGNSAKIIFRHYRKLVTKAEGKAWFRIRPIETEEKVVVCA